MEKKNVYRLLNTMIPFIALVLMQRLLLIIAGGFIPQGTLRSLISFVPSALVCIAVERLLPSVSYDEDETAVPPLAPVKLRYAVMSAATSASVLIVLMWLVSRLALGGTGDAPELNALNVISLVLIHPILEEYIFRNLFYNKMRPLSTVFAALAQAIMFALVHDSVAEMIFALLSGTVLAITCEHTGTWLTPLFVHMLINLRSLLYLTVIPDGMRDGIDTVFLALGLASAVMFFVIAGHELFLGRTASYTAEEGRDDNDGRK